MHLHLKRSIVNNVHGATLITQVLYNWITLFSVTGQFSQFIVDSTDISYCISSIGFFDFIIDGIFFVIIVMPTYLKSHITSSVCSLMLMDRALQTSCHFTFVFLMLMVKPICSWDASATSS